MKLQGTRLTTWRGPRRTGEAGPDFKNKEDPYMSVDASPAHPAPAPTSVAAPQREGLAARLAQVRARSLTLAAPLSAEDQCVQSMPDASPTKWHLAHTTWFFEAVVLGPLDVSYQAFDARFAYLFNSYYESLGARHPRPQRGLLTRPSLDGVHAYRRHVDAALARFAAGAGDAGWAQAAPLLELGLQHEQQHQELLLTDILHALSCNPLLPAYRPAEQQGLRLAATPPLRWLAHGGGTVQIGHEGAGFAFDNEGPRHPVRLQPFEIADRLVSCGDFAQFIADGGYRRPTLWLSDGWAAVQQQGWTAPAYWLAPGDPRAPSDGWQVFGLEGVRPLDAAAPVTQLSFYEAAAYAEWAGARLPTEFEWEAGAGLAGIGQLSGHAWQWTRSSYDPYPGFRPFAGAVGEYNGKFMVGQLVLRGGSLATPPGHSRLSYRNFFPPGARWQFSGLRLARDGAC
jgi:ergothioneine biosynthesis protein EgtB